MIYFMFDMCSQHMWPIANLVKLIIDLIKFGIPVLLIIFGMLDLGKAVMAGKEDEMKKAQGTLIKRVIYAVAVFLVVTIVMLIMDIVTDVGVKSGAGNQNTWYDCIFNRAAVTNTNTNTNQNSDGQCPDPNDAEDPDCED